MTDVNAAYELTPLPYVYFQELLKVAKLRRFTLEKYLAEAEAKNLIERKNEVIYITDQGKSYLEETGIIDA